MIDLVGLHIDTGYFSIFRAWEIFNNIIKQCIHTLTKNIGAHRHGNDASVTHIGAQCRSDLCFRKSFAAKITFHHFFTRLSNCFHQCITADLKIGFIVFRNFTLHNFLSLPSVTCLCDHIDISYKLFIFTDR